MDAQLPYGRTALHQAAEVGDLAAAESLIRGGAQVDARDEFGNTPLLRAVFQSREGGEMIAMLRQHGADPLAANHSGVTPTSLARDIVKQFDIKAFFRDVPDGPSHPPPNARPALNTGDIIPVPKGTYVWKKEFHRIFLLLVPVSGQAPTVQGELIRAAMKLTDEAYRNGNGNWDQGFDILVAFVAQTLQDSRVFTPEELQEIRQSVKAIADFERPDLNGDGSPYYILSEFAVRWCFAYPKLISRPLDRNLHR